MGIVTVGEVSYGVDDKLLKLWERNSLDNMKKHNNDKVYIVDGRERIGKSTWCIQQMGAIDKNAFSSVEEMKKRICLSAEKFNRACRELTNSVIIFDEAFRGLSSRAALSKINKLIVQTLMEMGQNNNIVFIVLPRIFLLDVYPAMLRSNGLFHIDLDAKRRFQRKWVGYNEEAKNMIYQMGTRKGWGYPFSSPMKGRFSKKFPGGPEFEEAYKQLKATAFQNKPEEEEEVETISKRYEKIHKQRDMTLKSMRKQFNSFKEFYNTYKSDGGDISPSRMRGILANTI